MPLYQIKQQKVDQIKPSSFKNERKLQKLFEANLETLLSTCKRISPHVERTKSERNAA